MGRLLVASWNVERTYSARELGNAELFRLQVKSTFDPPAELCDTKYADDRTCKFCGGDAEQTTPLRIDAKRVPRRSLMASSIAGEVVVSAEWVSTARAQDLTGFALTEVENCAPPHAPLPGWLQFRAASPRAVLSSRTSWGHTPFDLDPEGAHRCPRGHVGGLNVLSELHVVRSSWSGSDFAAATPAEGERAGVLRPKYPTLCSRRAYDFVRRYLARDVITEIAYLD
jgi:hypothetical protein